MRRGLRSVARAIERPHGFVSTYPFAMTVVCNTPFAE
jgi:hypothetical protein